MSEQFELDFDANVKEADDIEIAEYNFSPTLLENGVIDYSGIQHDKIFLVNKKDILEKARPNWIPELDIPGLLEDDFLPTTIKSSDGYYYVQTKEYVGMETNERTRVLEKKFETQIYKMSSDILAATVDYYIKKQRAINKKLGIKKTVSLPRKTKSMLTTRYKNMVELLRFVPEYKDNDELLRKYPNRSKSTAYKNQNTIIFNQYNELLSVLKGKTLDLNLAKQDFINAYAKGEITSYGDTGLSNALYQDYGVKIKKQNGSTFSLEQREKIKNALDSVYNYYGNLSNLTKQYGLKISYADNCNQHARKSIGLFTNYHKAIGVSFFDNLNDESLTMAHETAHWLDSLKGKEFSYRMASDKDGTIENKIAEKYKKLIKEENERQKDSTKLGERQKDSTKLGDYWYRTCECFARAIEQDFGLTIGLKERCHPPAYLSEEIFNKEIKPLIEELKKENEIKLNLIPGKFVTWTTKNKIKEELKEQEKENMSDVFDNKIENNEEYANELADWIIQESLECSVNKENYHISFEDIVEKTNTPIEWLNKNYKLVNEALAKHNDNELLEYNPEESNENEFNLNFCSNATENDKNTLFKQNKQGRWVRKTKEELEQKLKNNTKTIENAELNLIAPKYEIPRTLYLPTKDNFKSDVIKNKGKTITYMGEEYQIGDYEEGNNILLPKVHLTQYGHNIKWLYSNEFYREIEFGSIFETVSKEFNEKNKDFFNIYEEQKSKQIENLSKNISNIKEKMLFSEIHSEMLKIRVEELKEMVKRCPKKDNALAVGIRYFNYFGNIEGNISHQNLYTRFGIGHYENGQMVYPTPEELKSFISKLYENSKKQETYIWKRYEDGSCYLKAPNGEQYFAYDPDADEVQIKEDSNWIRIDELNLGDKTFTQYAEDYVLEKNPATYISFETNGKNIEKEQNVDESKQYSFFVKDTAEFEMFEEFETITGLTAKEAISEYKKLREDGLAAGIGINIPSDTTFNDPKGLGTTILVRENGIDTFGIYGDSFIVDLKENNERSQNRIAAYKELYEEAKKQGLNVKEPSFLFNKEKELQSLELKTYHILKEDDVKNLDVISDEDFSDIVDCIILNDYKHIPNVIRLPNLNEELSEKLGLSKDSAFILKKSATHIRPDRKGSYNQALDTEEYRMIPQVMRDATFALIDKRQKNFQIVFDDINNIEKINKIVFNKDELGNYLVTIGKVDRRDSISEQENVVVGVGVAPTISALRFPEELPATRLRPSPTTHNKNIAEIQNKSSKQEKTKLFIITENQSVRAIKGKDYYLLPTYEDAENYAERYREDIKAEWDEWKERNTFYSPATGTYIRDYNEYGDEEDEHSPYDDEPEEDLDPKPEKSEYTSYEVEEVDFDDERVKKLIESNNFREKDKELLTSLGLFETQQEEYSNSLEHEILELKENVLKTLIEKRKEIEDDLKDIEQKKHYQLAEAAKVSFTNSLSEINKKIENKIFELLKENNFNKNDYPQYTLEIDTYTVEQQDYFSINFKKDSSGIKLSVYEGKLDEKGNIENPSLDEEVKNLLKIFEASKVFLSVEEKVKSIFEFVELKEVVLPEESEEKKYLKNYKLYEVYKNGKKFGNISSYDNYDNPIFFTDNDEAYFKIFTSRKLVKGDEVLLNQEKVKNYLLREKAIGVYADYFIEREKNWQKNTELLEEIKAKDTSKIPNTSIWGSVQHCNKLIPGVYSVSTAGHGGILVHKNVADLVLSYEALKSGDFENGYYHYEEDCLSSVPVLEMYQKHLLQDLPWIENPSEEKRDSLFKRNQEVIFRDCPDYAKYFYDTYGKVQEISQNKDAEIITIDSYRVNHNHDYFLSEKAIEARIESAKDLTKAYFIENWEQNNKEDFIQKAIEYTLEPNSTILFDKSLKENEVEVYTKEEQEKMEQANNSIKEIIEHYSKELFETYNKSEELSSEDIKLINNFKKENNLNLLNNPTSVELVNNEIKSDEVAILFNYDIDKSKLNDLFVIDENNNKHLSDKDNNVKLSFKISSGSIINIDIQCYKENNIYNLSFWSDVTDTARKELCNLLKEPFKSINNNIDFTQKGWNDEWHKIHLEQAEQVNKKDNRNWILHEAPTGSLSKYINSDNVVDIDEFRDFAASKLEGNAEDKTYFKQMWILGAKFCKEKGWDLPEISLSELLDEPGEKYNKDLIEIFTDDEEFEQISNNKYVMEESEFNVVQKILTESKMDGSFDVIQLDNIDVFIDYDEDKIVSLKTGLSWLSDGLVEPTTDELSVEELSILKELLCKQNLFDKIDYINGLLEERSSEHPVSFSLRDITDEQLVEHKEHLSDIPLMPKVTTVETKTQIIKENIELPFSIINNVEKGRVNIKFNQKISDKKFNSILKELKSAGWKFSSFNKQWYPDGKAVEKSETFAKELQEKFAIPEEKMTFAANTIEETESQIHNDPYGRVRFFGRNYKELDDFVTYFNRNLDKFSKNVEKIDESIAETIFESLKIERSSAINLRSLRLGLDSADNLVLLDKEKSNTQTKVISLPELLSLAKSNLEKEKNEIDLKLANFEKAENKEQCIKVFGNLLQNAKDKNTNLLSKMNLVYETYISEPKPKQLAKKISKVKPLKIGDFVGDEMVQDVFKVSNGIYQATLAKNMYKGAFAVGTYFVLDKNIVKKLNPELHQFLEDKGEFSIFETSSRITPHIIKYLIDKKLCPPRDNEYYQQLELHTEKNPLKYEVLYPITKYGFKNKLKQIYEIDKHINNDILSIGKKLLSLATEYDKKEISEWLKNDMGCEDENSLKKLFTNWVSEKEIKQQKKIDGYHSRGE